MRHVEGSAHSNSVSLTPTFKKGVRDLIGSAKEQKLAICSVKEGLIRGRAEARESGNTYSQIFVVETIDTCDTSNECYGQTS